MKNAHGCVKRYSKTTSGITTVEVDTSDGPVVVIVSPKHGKGAQGLFDVPDELVIEQVK